MTAGLIKAARRFSTTIGAGGVDDASVTTIPMTLIPPIFSDNDYIEIVVDRVSITGELTTDKEEVLVGQVSGTNIVNAERGVEGTAQAHSAGAVVEIKLTADMWNRMIDGILAEHTQAGLHDVAGMITGGSVIDENDMASDSDTALATQQSIKAMHDTGWTAITETFTYASATTITIATGGASRYQKGDKLKLTQTTDKYFYIVKVEDELLTITGGSDYTLDDAAITSPQLSRIETPFGFPGWFNFTPSYVNITSVTTYIAIFKIAGEFCTYNIFFNGTTESAVSFLAVSYPVGAPQNSFWIPVFVRDSTRYAGLSECTTNLQRFHRGDLGNFGVGGNRGGSCSNTYRYVI